MFFQDDKEKNPDLRRASRTSPVQLIMDKRTRYSNIHDNFHVAHRGMFVMHVAHGLMDGQPFPKSHILNPKQHNWPSGSYLSGWSC